MADDAPLEEADKQLLEENQVERARIAEEIKELRERNERRKKEREEEEKRLAAERAAEDARRKAEEEERKRKKEEEEQNRRKALELKRAEFEKWKIPQKANFVISKKTAEDGSEEIEMNEGQAKKSKEQLEAEKRAILNQRIRPLEINGFEQRQLADKAKELHNQIVRLEGEKYDLEKRFKQLQVEMMELAERARQANRVGKEGLKRVPGAEDEVDKIQTRFAGAPAKVEMFSKYERQKDKRSYVERKVVYTGPQYILPPERIRPTKTIKWNEEGMPEYHEGGGAGDQAPPQPESAEQVEPVAE
jgi:troponin T